MKRNNTMNRSDFLIKHLLWALAAMLYDRILLFRCLDSCTRLQSHLILCALVAASCILGYCFDRRNNRNHRSLVINVGADFGLYAVLTYGSLRRGLAIGLLGVAAAISVGCAVLILIRSHGNRAYSWQLLRRRMTEIAASVHKLFGIALSVFAIILAVSVAFGSGIIGASYRTAPSVESSAMNESDKLLALKPMKPDQWFSLDPQSRTDVLQQLAWIEKDRLGLPNDLNVGVRELPENVLGCYEDNTRTIWISIDLLLSGDPERVMETVCHESYHSYQHRMADLYASVDPEFRELSCIRDGGVYISEFISYIDGNEDYAGYYEQACESDARSYAEREAGYIWEFLNV